MKILILADHFGVAGGAGTIARLQAGLLSKDHEVEVLTANAPKQIKVESYKLTVINELEYNLKLRNYRGLRNKRALEILNDYLAKFRPEVCIIHNLHTYWSYASLPLIKKHQAKSLLVFHDVSIFTNYSKLCDIKYKKTPPGHPELARLAESRQVSEPVPNSFRESEQIPDQARNDSYVFNYKYPWYRFLREYYFGFYNPLRQFFIKKYLRSATKTITVSYALADALRQNNIRVDDVVHNGVSKLPVTDYQLTVTSGDSILFIGKTVTQKGVLQIVDYLVYLKDKYQLTPTLEIAGSRGPGFDKMMSKAKAQGVAKQIKIHGWIERDKFAQVLASCSHVIVPSICFDSFPTVILEAYQYQKPVIASIFGGAKEIIKHGQTGFIADPFSIEQFAEHIKTLLEDKQKADTMGQAGLSLINSDFSLEKQTKKLIAIISN